MGILYIFVDEAGNLDFTCKGTHYFILTAMSKNRPFLVTEQLINLKYNLWEKDIDFEYFHATEDTQLTRGEVFKILSKQHKKFTIDSIVVEKQKTHPSLHLGARFYQKIFKILLSYILNRNKENYKKIIIITDNIPIKKNRRNIEKAIKQFISSWSIEYKILHYSSKSDINLQIVDYFNWAIFRKWERDDLRSYNLIRNVIKSEFDVFRAGQKYFY